MKALGVSFLTFAIVSLSFSASLQFIPKTTGSEQALVVDSRRAIIETGFSPEYFDVHFTLVTVVDKSSDRRVVWRFAINGYETRLTDSIGSYAEGTTLIYTHSVASVLGHTSEIKRTISHARALRIMKMCIGNFENPGVEYGQVDGYAQLFLIANHSRLQRNQVEIGRQPHGKKAAEASGIDVIKPEENNDERTPVRLGSVNLQTGKCTRGNGLIAP